MVVTSERSELVCCRGAAFEGCGQTCFQSENEVWPYSSKTDFLYV